MQILLIRNTDTWNINADTLNMLICIIEIWNANISQIFPLLNSAEVHAFDNKQNNKQKY